MNQDPAKQIATTNRECCTTVRLPRRCLVAAISLPVISVHIFTLRTNAAIPRVKCRPRVELTYFACSIAYNRDSVLM